MPSQIELLKKYSLQVRGHLGQHLLIDPNMQRKIVDLLDLQPDDRVLEIGPGLGALTAEMFKRGLKKIWVVEKDERFANALEKEFSVPGKKLEIFQGDILKTDLKKILSPGKRYKVVSNLPYYITAPILFHLIESKDLFSRAVFTMQKEVAERLLASPGSKNYGRLTLGVRYSADVGHAFDISRSCFTPQPEVDSSVVTLSFHSSDSLSSAKEDFLFHIIQVAFSQRRKMLMHLLSRDPKIAQDREHLIPIFESAGISPQARGEELLLKDYLTLMEKLPLPASSQKKRQSRKGE